MPGLVGTPGGTGLESSQDPDRWTALPPDGGALASCHSSPSPCIHRNCSRRRDGPSPWRVARTSPRHDPRRSSIGITTLSRANSVNCTLIWARDLDLLTAAVRVIEADDTGSPTTSTVGPTLMEPLGLELARLSRHLAAKAALIEQERRADAGMSWAGCGPLLVMLCRDKDQLAGEIRRPRRITSARSLSGGAASSATCAPRFDQAAADAGERRAPI